MWLADFRVHRPAHETDQGHGLGWLARAHARAELVRHESGAADRDTSGKAFDPIDFERRIRRVMDKVACGPDKIARRGHMLGDFLHDRWSDMEVYRLDRSPHGVSMDARNAFYQRTINKTFEEMYAADDTPPRHLIHVTCTGYVSPSGAQEIVAARSWGNRTTVTHAYHMGCYASLPAVRMARGFAAIDGLDAHASPAAERRVDIVHTELCTLHLDPGNHSPEQLVVQSLFADGAIRYALHAARPDAPALRVLATDEVIAADSTASMSWALGDHGMHMTLARDVPDRIAAVVGSFVQSLFDRAGLDAAKESPGALFAVHPGGPKIIDRVRAALELSEAQVAHGRSVLLRYGNMSSATLPHVWSDLLADPDALNGQLVISLAFGPGLTLAGGLFRIER